jgi:hypothetical protein
LEFEPLVVPPPSRNARRCIPWQLGVFKDAGTKLFDIEFQVVSPKSK